MLGLHHGESFGGSFAVAEQVAQDFLVAGLFKLRFTADRELLVAHLADPKCSGGLLLLARLGRAGQRVGQRVAVEQIAAEQLHLLTAGR